MRNKTKILKKNIYEEINEAESTGNNKEDEIGSSEEENESVNDDVNKDINNIEGVIEKDDVTLSS